MQHNTDGSFLFQYPAELSPSWLPLQLGSESSRSWTQNSTNQPRVTTRQSKSVASRFILWFKAFCSLSSLESFGRNFLHTHTFLNISTKCSCRCRCGPRHHTPSLSQHRCNWESEERRTGLRSKLPGPRGNTPALSWNGRSGAPISYALINHWTEH